MKNSRRNWLSFARSLPLSLFTWFTRFASLLLFAHCFVFGFSPLSKWIFKVEWAVDWMAERKREKKAKVMSIRMRSRNRRPDEWKGQTATKSKMHGTKAAFNRSIGMHCCVRVFQVPISSCVTIFPLAVVDCWMLKNESPNRSTHREREMPSSCKQISIIR